MKIAGLLVVIFFSGIMFSNAQKLNANANRLIDSVGSDTSQVVFFHIRQKPRTIAEAGNMPVRSLDNTMDAKIWKKMTGKQSIPIPNASILDASNAFLTKDRLDTININKSEILKNIVADTLNR